MSLCVACSCEILKASAEWTGILINELDNAGEILLPPKLEQMILEDDILMRHSLITFEPGSHADRWLSRKSLTDCRSLDS